MKLADKVYRSMVKDSDIAKEGHKLLDSGGYLKNSKLEKNLLKNEVGKRNAIATPNYQGANAEITKDGMIYSAKRNFKEARQIKDWYNREYPTQYGYPEFPSHLIGYRDRMKYGKRLSRALAKGKQFEIRYDRREGPETLAHELGHVMNKEKKKLYDIPGKYQNIISKANKKLRGDQKILMENGPDGSSKLRDAFKRFVSSKVIQAEERNASRNALKLLKKNGATKEELKKAERNLKAMGDTYKNEDIPWKHVVREKLLIPSRRMRKG